MSAPDYVCAQLHTQLPPQTCQCIRGDALMRPSRKLVCAIEPAQLTSPWSHRASRSASRAIDHQCTCASSGAAYQAERLGGAMSSGAGISLSGP